MIGIVIVVVAFLFIIIIIIIIFIGTSVKLFSSKEKSSFVSYYEKVFPVIIKIGCIDVVIVVIVVIVVVVVVFVIVSFKS